MRQMVANLGYIRLFSWLLGSTEGLERSRKGSQMAPSQAEARTTARGYPQRAPGAVHRLSTCLSTGYPHTYPQVIHGLCTGIRTGCPHAYAQVIHVAIYDC